MKNIKRLCWVIIGLTILNLLLNRLSKKYRWLVPIYYTIQIVQIIVQVILVVLLVLISPITLLYLSIIAIVLGVITGLICNHYNYDIDNEEYYFVIINISIIINGIIILLLI